MRYSWLLQLISLYIFNVAWLQSAVIPFEIAGQVVELSTQGFAIFALIVIWLYNGNRGSGGKIMQYIIYAFYPLHLLILYLLTMI